MKALKFFSTIMLSLFMAVFAGSAIGFGLNIDPGVPIGILAGVSLIPMNMAGVLPMAVQKEIWVNHIIGNLFKNNEFSIFFCLCI